MNVLYVDDEATLRRAVHYWLERRGYLVHTARSVYGAKRCFRAHHIDVAFLDLWLPDGSALDIFEWLVEQQPRVADRTILVTADLMPDPAVKARIAATGCPLLSKPFDLDALEPFIERWKDASPLRMSNRPGRSQAPVG